MINLLPSRQKKFLRKDYHLRVLSVVAAMFSVFVFMSIFALSPTYFLIVQKNESILNESKSSLALSQKTKEEELEEIVKSANEKILILSNNNGGVLFGDIFKTILATKPDNVYISDISFSRSVVKAANNKEPLKNATESVSVVGSAKTRDELLLFVKKLKQEPLFLFVDLPVSSLVNEFDINYSITIFVGSKA